MPLIQGSDFQVQELPTIEIDDGAGGKTIINRADFDPKIHTEFGKSKTIAQAATASADESPKPERSSSRRKPKAEPAAKTRSSKPKAEPAPKTRSSKPKDTKPTKVSEVRAETAAEPPYDAKLQRIADLEQLYETEGYGAIAAIAEPLGIRKPTRGWKFAIPDIAEREVAIGASK